MLLRAAVNLDVTAVVVSCDDEERVGHVVRRVAAHLRALGLAFEVLAVDEGSGDNTLSLLALMKKQVPELQIVAGVALGRGLQRGAELARGRSILLLDARTEPPLPAIGFALARLDDGYDGVALAGRCLALHRTRTLRAFDALEHHRDAADLARRFERRARALGLRFHTATTRRESPFPSLRKLRDLLSIRKLR